MSAEGFLLKENFVPEITTHKIFKHPFGIQVAEIYQKLGGIADWQKIKIPAIDLWANDYFITIDDYLQFNRYRAVTLGADFYSLTNVFDREQYLRYCRQFEAECKKAGKAGAFWSHPEAERHFGSPGVAGDFYEAGSPAWKLRAMQALLLDIAAHIAKMKFIRISSYANLMTGGKLERLDKFFIKSDEVSTKVQSQWLKRTLEKAN